MTDEAGDFRMIIVNGVQHRDRDQGAVGVLAEILVARRVEEVEGEPLVLEAITAEVTEMPPLVDRHPIRAHPPPQALTSPVNWIASLDLHQRLVHPGCGISCDD